MGFIKHINLKTVFGLVLFASVWLATPALAQEPDTAEQAADTVEVAAAADTAAADTAAAGATDEAAAAADTPATASSVSATPTATSDADGKLSLDPQVYKNFYYYLLLFVLTCVLIAVMGRILDVYDLTRKMNGKDNFYFHNDIQAVFFLIALIVGLYGVYWSYANHGAQSIREPATLHGQNVHIMFMVTTIIATIVLIVMHIGLFSFVYLYRSRPQRKAYFYPHNNTIEKIWTIVPAIVLTILVIFGFFNWRSITNVSQEEQDRAIKIEVVGEQFMWTVRYAGRDGVIGERNYKLTTPTNNQGIDFNDKNSWDDQMGADIVIPVNQPVRFQITSKDVLHSFFIPDFRVQINAVPGMKTYFQFTPTITTAEMRDKLDDHNYDFVMLCAKICGQAHFNMQKTVRVVTEEEYREWLNEQPYFFTEELRKEFQVSQGTTAEDTEEATLLATAN